MTIHFGWPQTLVILLSIIGLVLVARDHGKPRKPENIWTHLVGVAITYSLLIWGGFFR